MNLIGKISQIRFMRLGTLPCPMCRKKKNYFYTTSKGVHGCQDCILKKLQKQIGAANISEWSWERFTYSLSPAGTMEDRLMALFHFSHFHGMAKLPQLLVDNLGFETDHSLSNLVRQKALDACRTFKDRDRILSPLLNHKNYTTWHQKANIARAAYCLAPTMARVKSLVIRMAKDDSPNVRAHVAETIQDDTNGWATSLFKELARDRNPLVREACQKKKTIHGTTNRSTANRPSRKKGNRIDSNAKALPPKESRPPNPIEKIVLRCFDFPDPEKVYELYLGHIPDLLDPKQYSPEEIKGLKQNTKQSRVHLLGAALGNRTLFESLVDKLPEPARGMLHVCQNENFGLGLGTAEQKRIQTTGKECPPKMDEALLFERLKKDPGFFLFKIEKGWPGCRESNHFEIAINQGYLPFVRKLLPKPDPPRLIQVTAKTVEKKVEHLQVDNQEIFETLPIILSFIAQDKLKYAKNSDQILPGSLKRMAAVCKIREFYADGDKAVLWLKSRLIADFFICKSAWVPQELDDLPKFIKTTVDDYFKFKGLKTHRTRDSFDFIKRQMAKYDSDRNEATIRTQLRKIMALLPDREWVGITSLAAVGAQRGFDLSPFSDKYELSELYITMDGTNSYLKRNRVGLERLYRFDTTTLPHIRRMMFLFGALGMVDLAYAPPENALYRVCSKPYLSPFDGLKYVRLTEFGRYVLGRTRRYTTTVTISSGTIEVDANKTLLSIQGEDPIKRMVLEAVGEPINQTSYRVDFNSFLKECTTATEVKNKISFFRENIAEHPPAVWEHFFEDLLARINPIKPVPALSVFKVKPDRELLSLLSSDSLLKQYVMRAENHHMVVEKVHLAKVKKRLAQFGYFVS